MHTTDGVSMGAQQTVAGDDPSCDERVDALQLQLDEMTDHVKQLIDLQQHTMADAKARENALQAQLRAVQTANKDTQNTDTKPNPTSTLTFNPFDQCDVRFSSAEARACEWSGKRGGMDWRTARSTLVKTVSVYSLRMRAIALNEFTRGDACCYGQAALQMWEQDNLILAGLVFRTISSTTKEGIALRAQIVQDASRQVIVNKRWAPEPELDRCPAKARTREGAGNSPAPHSSGGVSKEAPPPRSMKQHIMSCMYGS